MFKGQKIIIHPMTPEQILKDDLARVAKTAKQLEPSTSINSEIKLNAPVLLATRADFDELRDAPLPCYALICSSVLVSLDDAPSLDIPPAVANILQEYADVFPKDLPPGLPPHRGIEHQIDLIPGAQLPNHSNESMSDANVAEQVKRPMAREAPPQPRTSARLREMQEILLLDNDEPVTYAEAMMDPDSEKWQSAMQSEIESMGDNQVWNLVDPPVSVKAIECKWIYKKKKDMDGNVHIYKA